MQGTEIISLTFSPQQLKKERERKLGRDKEKVKLREIPRLAHLLSSHLSYTLVVLRISKSIPCYSHLMKK